MIKFIPYPVTTGFTAGIAVIIFSSQMKDFFGLQMGGAAAGLRREVVRVLRTRSGARDQRYATAIALGGVVVIALLRRFAPRIPGAIVAVVLASLAVSLYSTSKRTGRRDDRQQVRRHPAHAAGAELRLAERHQLEQGPRR